MKTHVYDPASGEFRVICINPTSQRVAAWEAEGLSVVEGPRVERSDYNYLGGVLTTKIAVSLVPDKASIDADGADQAVVTVTVAAEAPPASIELLVAGSLETLNLSGGQGTLDPITAETPCTLQIELADTITYRGGPVEIEAVAHG